VGFASVRIELVVFVCEVQYQIKRPGNPMIRFAVVAMKSLRMLFPWLYAK
jgi:hypothetical protein